MTRAVVVDDSHFMRVQITDLLEDGGITVVDEARNGKEAVETVRKADPDIVTMDVKMPGMDGIEAVERIMATHPTPILMLSRYTEEGADTTFQALEAGAVDFFMKPGGEVSTTLVQYADDLVEAVSLVAKADVSKTTGDGASGVTTEAPETAERPESPPTVVIAASTGGPREIQSILRTLPATIDARVLVVQHMPGNFTDRFSERLDTVSALDVHEAVPDGTVEPGQVVVAKGGYHLEVRDDDGRTVEYELTENEPVHNVRPAADVTFESAADHCTSPMLGVVLSGMGKDGAAGVTHVADAGGTVIVQDPATASISAMPERAIETESVDDILPIREIPDAIVDAVLE